MQLVKYNDFIDRVDELGFMSFSNILPGLPSLVEETPRGIWHTGLETDPWCWKDRAAEEKKLAFGCILGGHKGFVSARMYSIFYKAFHPKEHMVERRASGLVNQTTWQLWQLFEGRTSLNTGSIRREMGVSKGKGGSKADAAVKELQQLYYITVTGSMRKLDKFGQPYGWAINTYDKVQDWVPEEWMKADPGITREEALEIILDTGVEIGKNIDRTALAKVLRG